MLKVTLPFRNMRVAAVHMTSTGCSLNAMSARIMCRSCSSIAFAVIGVRCPGKRFSTGKQWARKQDNVCIHDAALGTRQLATARPAPSTQTRQHISEEGLNTDALNRTILRSSRCRFSSNRDEICKKWERFQRPDSRKHTERRAKAVPVKEDVSGIQLT